MFFSYHRPGMSSFSRGWCLFSQTTLEVLNIGADHVDVGKERLMGRFFELQGNGDGTYQCLACATPPRGRRKIKPITLRGLQTHLTSHFVFISCIECGLTSNNLHTLSMLHKGKDCIEKGFIQYDLEHAPKVVEALLRSGVQPGPHPTTFDSFKLALNKMFDTRMCSSFTDAKAMAGVNEEVSRIFTVRRTSVDL